MASSKDFAEFKKTFMKYQQLFGCTGYKIFFEREKLKNDCANITIRDECRIATVKLDSALPEREKKDQPIELLAKHEAIHLLLARYVHYAESRYVNEEQVIEAEEELVRKLEKLIP